VTQASAENAPETPARRRRTQRKPVVRSVGGREPTTGTDAFYSKPTEAVQEKTWFTTREAAAYLEVGKSTLEKYRAEGRGPAYHRHDAPRGVILYKRADMDAWHEGFLVRVDTSDSLAVGLSED
jgi:excisionase family DNA binding protein